MKKKIALLFAVLLVFTFLAGCGSKQVVEGGDSEYKTQMTDFFKSMKHIDDEINALDPEDDDSIAELFVYLDELEGQYKILSEIEVPAEYKATESLADEAYDYMVQANNYFKMSFVENSYNQYTYEAGLECYNRANKRMQYIISIIHGEMPTDENVTVE